MISLQLQGHRGTGEPPPLADTHGLAGGRQQEPQLQKQPLGIRGSFLPALLFTLPLASLVPGPEGAGQGLCTPTDLGSHLAGGFNLQEAASLHVQNGRPCLTERSVDSVTGCVSAAVTSAFSRGSPESPLNHRGKRRAPCSCGRPSTWGFIKTRVRPKCTFCQGSQAGLET